MIVPGVKHDSEKLRWDLLPFREVRQVVAVLNHGAARYDDYNWQLVRPFFRRYFNAMMRHIYARFFLRRRLDPDSGLPHLAHAACCLLFLMWGDNEIRKKKRIGTHGKTTNRPTQTGT